MQVLNHQKKGAHLNTIERLSLSHWTHSWKPPKWWPYHFSQQNVWHPHKTKYPPPQTLKADPTQILHTNLTVHMQLAILWWNNVHLPCFQYSSFSTVQIVKAIPRNSNGLCKWLVNIHDANPMSAPTPTNSQWIFYTTTAQYGIHKDTQWYTQWRLRINKWCKVLCYLE
jgi:hypothetical protein